MSQFELSIAFQSNKTPAEYAALAKIVDGYAFDRVSIYNDLMFQPALGPLILMAQHLRRAHVGFAALNPYTVHPVEIAGQIAVLDMVAQGRACLGLAKGGWLDEVGVDTPRPITALRECALVVRHLLARNPAAFEGEIFRIAPNTTLNYAPVRSNVPIMIGTWGVQTARMAGELVDEIKIGGSSNPDMAQHLRPALDEGSRKTGRQAGSVGICLGAVTVIDEDRAAARAKVRKEAALYLPVVAKLDPTLNDPEWLARIEAAEVRKDYDAISRDISDDVLERFAFAGNPDDISRQTQRLREAGATRVEFGTPHCLSDPAHGIRLLGEKVLPAFSR
jgi:5,10-methylenetetrahydromethanopterin reductase